MTSCSSYILRQLDICQIYRCLSQCPRFRLSSVNICIGYSSRECDLYVITTDYNRGIPTSYSITTDSNRLRTCRLSTTIIRRTTDSNCLIFCRARMSTDRNTIIATSNNTRTNTDCSISISIRSPKFATCSYNYTRHITSSCILTNFNRAFVC